MAHKGARKSRQHGEMLTETTLNCRKLLENSLETNRLCWMTEMARLFSIALERHFGAYGTTFCLAGRLPSRRVPVPQTSTRWVRPGLGSSLRMVANV